MFVAKGQNSSTCDPWTSRDFNNEMRNQPSKCHQCLSGGTCWNLFVNIVVVEQLFLLRLWPHHLPGHVVLCRIQVSPNLLRTTDQLKSDPSSIPFSSCDSRNLNLSPFCNTSSTSLAMWEPSVLETYGEEGTLDYLDKITGPKRKKYPNSMGEREIITSLTEVAIQILFSDNSMSPSNI